jgi:hypothetical protein
MIAAVTALIGAGGFTTYSFLGASHDGGAATPEEAVLTFVSAMEHEDLLGMIDVTLPQEVGALRAAVDSITSDAKRVHLLGDEINTSAVQGVDVSVDDLVLDTNFLEGGLAAVTATSGTVSASFDPQTFPIGDTLRPFVDESTGAGSSLWVLDDQASPALLMTVERDARWYVSVEYTVAEYIRRAAGWEVPGPVSRTPVGFDSPEAAVDGFYDRLDSLDLQSAMETFAPGEDAMAWLAQGWLADAQAAIDRGRAEGWSVAISGLAYETIGEGDRLTLRPITFKAEGTVPAGLNQDSVGSAEASDPATGGPQPFTIERADGCTTVTGEGIRSGFGSEPPPTATVVDGGFQLCGSGNELLGGIAFLVTGSAIQLPSVSVVQSDGKWYVSPLGMVLTSATVNLHDITEGSGLFDTPIAPYIYGVDPNYLTAMVEGLAADAVDPACLPAVAIDNGIVTGIVDNPSPDAIRACSEMASFGGAVSESGSESVPPPTKETIPPASTVP